MDYNGLIVTKSELQMKSFDSDSWYCLLLETGWDDPILLDIITDDAKGSLSEKTKSSDISKDVIQHGVLFLEQQKLCISKGIWNHSLSV